MGDARFPWFADTMTLGPADRVLEIGPGASPSLSLLAERVPEGRVIGVERSATAVARAAQRLRAAGHDPWVHGAVPNEGAAVAARHSTATRTEAREGPAGHGASRGGAEPREDEAAQGDSGRVGLVHVELNKLRPEQVLDDFGIDAFDKVLAVNVNVFWTKRPTAELALIRRLLAPGGGLYLCYGYGDPDGAASSPKPPPGRLGEHLTEAGFAVRTVASGDLLCVIAELDQLPARLSRTAQAQ
ncbi:class I SAM-dependent methyltransferase [Nocardia amikacinitolerans]|uniref:class I SAM-dependent methyltransferase n=1 Tax=Nocardia amikacinitolerans TaxID=756689 RepID=UPI0020A59E94|nr:class I SAM-dependent methyltransferase [Nocardia amikacinitolerans]MCP2291789.1 Protein-L-isoaspartate(D-aspartate) O-methyltransferase (PCMT) [Nocardia amikacinitolerans]